MDTLEAIIKHGLSVRQIPTTRHECWLVSRTKDIPMYLNDPSYSLRMSVLTDKMSEKTFNKNVKPYDPDGEYSHFDTKTGKLWRLSAYRETPVTNGGHWMCKHQGDTSSTVQWDMKKDNLAPTLADSVALFITNNSQKN